ncbi:MAG: PilZ domain-containing protein [Planctomycetes bacterium]|nr:PilZ domain-containing protein [Planctomycetota bacterium]
MDASYSAAKQSSESKTSDSRRYKRYPTQVPAFYRFCSAQGVAEEAYAHQGLAEDFSEGGFKLRGFPKANAAPQDAAGSDWHLSITLTMPDGAVVALCRICHVQLQSDADPDLSWAYGLEVIGIEALHRERLKKLCLKAKIIEATPL